MARVFIYILFSIKTKLETFKCINKFGRFQVPELKRPLLTSNQNLKKKNISSILQRNFFTIFKISIALNGLYA